MDTFGPKLKITCIVYHDLKSDIIRRPDTKLEDTRWYRLMPH